MEQAIRWGILGTGNIASQFARGLRDCPGANLVAVGSRSIQTARAFGERFGVPYCYGSYGEVAGDPEVDVVYIATPHTLHRDNMMTCLEAGKPVLCEKPFAINALQTQEVIGAAARKGLFAMEAMWTRFLPPIMEVYKLLSDDAIGDVRLVAADLGFDLPFDPAGRLFNPELAGGCLLDVGIYPISLATTILGEPCGVCGQTTIGPTGVDEQNAISLRYPDGQLASLYAAIRLQTPLKAHVLGSKGGIDLHSHWWKGGPFTLRQGSQTREFDIRVAGNGYQYEAQEVQRCLLAGQTQSQIMPLEQTLAALRITDELRRQWGLKYPME